MKRGTRGAKPPTVANLGSLVGGGVAGAVAGAMAWGIGVEPYRVVYRRARVRPRNPPIGAGSPTREGPTIVQLSDLHLHRIGPVHEEIVGHISELQPDLIVFTGDTVHHRSALPALERFLALLDAEVPKLAVMGNWEYAAGIGKDDMEYLFERAMGTVLVNRSVRVGTPAGLVRVTGLDDLLKGTPDLAAALNDVEEEPAPHILLAHCPAQQDRLRASLRGIEADRRTEGRPLPTPPFLTLSGHTHGGQVNVFGLTWTPKGSGRYVRGWYLEPGLPGLFVSRGIGTVIPIRLGSTPEVAIFELEGQDSSTRPPKARRASK